MVNRWSPLQWFADLWLTGDQQGRLLMQGGDYRTAASHFDSTMWKGLAYYYAEDFMLAAEYFSRSDSDDALFNEANARAHARDYVRAVNRYDRLLARSPEYPGALQNRERVQAIIDEINRLSESQQQEQGVSGEDKELGSDDAIPAQGAEEITWEQADTVTLSAEDILQDPETAEMWMRSVQQDPSNFLAIKFGMQLQTSGKRREGTTVMRLRGSHVFVNGFVNGFAACCWPLLCSPARLPWPQPTTSRRWSRRANCK